MSFALLHGCGGSTTRSLGPATQASSSPPAAAGTSITGRRECTIAGRTELSLSNVHSGCPLPVSIDLVDGRGNTAIAGGGVIEWTLVSEGEDGEGCRYHLAGSMGRLFSIEATVGGTAASLRGDGRATSGKTRYACGGTFELTGTRSER